MMKVVRIILVILLAMVFGVAVMLMLPMLLLYAGVKIITGVASKI